MGCSVRLTVVRRERTRTRRGSGRQVGLDAISPNEWLSFLKNMIRVIGLQENPAVDMHCYENLPALSSCQN
jgi:hypothetical protein